MPFKDREAARAWQREYYNRLHHEGKSWACRNPEKVKAKRRRRTLKQYGLTPESWDLQFEKQGSACVICKTKKTSQWHTDHDHETGKFRGILCKKCNNGIGQLQDSPALLRAAAEYLEERSRECGEEGESQQSVKLSPPGCAGSTPAAPTKGSKA